MVQVRPEHPVHAKRVGLVVEVLAGTPSAVMVNLYDYAGGATKMRTADLVVVGPLPWP